MNFKEAPMAPIDAYNTFMLLHNRSKEKYDPTPDNVRRWEWHIRQAANRPKGEKVFFDYTLIDALRKERGVTSFNQLPEITKVIYLYIASMYEGEQVYACGSRVRGDYNEDNNEGINFARIMAGMRAQSTSDFDYYVRRGAVAKGSIPEKFNIKIDRVRTVLPLDEMIKVPIFKPKQDGV